MENTQFEVYRDGSPDPDYKRKIIIRKAKASIKKALSRISRAISQAFGPVMAEWDLYNYDKRHGTALRAEFLRNRRQASISATRQQYGL